MKPLDNADDTHYMRCALDLAVRGRGYTSPNPMVGAVIVKKDKIIGQGFHQAVGEAHAEVNALKNAGKNAQGATLYVTLEPCNHVGRTPPCTQSILDSGIKRVVVAMQDPNPQVEGGGIEVLKQKGLRVNVGVCEAEARKLNENFIKFITSQRPFVILKCAATLDGRIATRTGDAKWVSGKESRQFVHRLRHATDAIMVGIDTVKSDNPQLTTRLPKRTNGKAWRDPVRIILDSKLSIAPDAHVVKHHSKANTILIANENTPTNQALLKNRGVEILRIPDQDGRTDLNALMDQLGAKGITSLLIEGGSRVIASALAARIVDKICFFYAPKISGGDDGIPICRGPGPAKMIDCINVKNIEIHRFGDDTLIEGYIDKTDAFESFSGCPGTQRNGNI